MPDPLWYTSFSQMLNCSHTVRLVVFSGRANLPDVRNGKSELRRPFTPPPRQREAADYDGPEWSIAEDHTALSVGAGFPLNC